MAMYKKAEEAKLCDEKGKKTVSKLAETGLLTVEDLSAQSGRLKYGIDLKFTHTASGLVRFIDAELRLPRKKNPWIGKFFRYDTIHVVPRKEKFVDPGVNFFASVNPSGESFYLVDSALCTEDRLTDVHVGAGTLREGQESFTQYMYDVPKELTFMVDLAKVDTAGLLKYLKLEG